jgi:hypothetical protein
MLDLCSSKVYGESDQITVYFKFVLESKTAQFVLSSNSIFCSEVYFLFVLRRNGIT